MGVGAGVAIAVDVGVSVGVGVGVDVGTMTDLGRRGCQGQGRSSIAFLP